MHLIDNVKVTFENRYINILVSVRWLVECLSVSPGKFLLGGECKSFSLPFLYNKHSQMENIFFSLNMSLDIFLSWNIS